MPDISGMDMKRSNQTNGQPERLGLTAEQAAVLIGIGRAHFFKLRSADRIPAPLRLGRCVRWLRDDLVEWLRLGCPPRERFEAMCKDDCVGVFPTATLADPPLGAAPLAPAKPAHPQPPILS